MNYDVVANLANVLDGFVNTIGLEKVLAVNFCTSEKNTVVVFRTEVKEVRVIFNLDEESNPISAQVNGSTYKYEPDSPDATWVKK